MNDNPDSAERYRKRAEELRAIAQTMKDASARGSLLEIAEDYERMARSREQMDKMDPQHRR